MIFKDSFKYTKSTNFDIFINILFFSFLFFSFSDLDLVLFGKWPELPLRTLERALTARNIAKEDSILVLDKAAVSKNSFFVLHIPL